MCKKQTSVSHSSTEAELISPDAGLRTDEIPALDLWDLWKCFTLHQTRSTKPKMLESHGKPVANSSTKHAKTDSNHAHQCRSDQHWSRSIKRNTHSGSSAMLYVFEDNEAMIKMIIKGRSPTMRHVSRTHRVALDWLFDRINLDPKIEIRYIDPKHQFADILTKGNFVRNEWKNLLHLFIISHFSSTCCAKLLQNDGEEDAGMTRRRKSCGKIESTAMNLSSHVPTRCSSAISLIASKSSGKLTASVKPESRVRRNSKSDAASSSQVKLQDAYLGGLMDTATEKIYGRSTVWTWPGQRQGHLHVNVQRQCMVRRRKRKK